MQERLDKAIDCNTCEYRQPELDQANYDVWYLYQAVCTQWRTLAYVGRTGLDYNAVYAVADTLGIDITPAVLEKLRAIEMEELVRQKEG